MIELMLIEKKKLILDWYHKNEKKLDIAFFSGGFLLDILLISEIDDLFSILQQFFYLLLIALIIHYEILFRANKWQPKKLMEKIWELRILCLHFLLGGLLNTYSLFYVKSASLMSSLIFMLVMVGIVLANELPMVKASRASYKVAMFSVCLFSFFAILWPVILGFVGWIPFSLAVLSAGAIHAIQLRFLKQSLTEPQEFYRAIAFPSVTVMLMFVFFYSLGWIPPVPLSVKEQGIYHLVEKKEGAYFLSSNREWWRFWQTGDQYFRAEPNDKIYFYVEVFSPARFSDSVNIHWSIKNKNNDWQTWDRIPLKIVGGRRQGYRGFTYKSNFQPGSWRVQVETLQGLEISRFYFEVEKVEPDPERQFKLVKR